MSDQRKLKSEARQGFYQFAMHLYQLYKQTYTEDESKALVVEAIKEQLRLFMASDSSLGEASIVIRQRIELLREKLGKVKGDYDMEMRYGEMLDTLEKALGILESNE